jgi:hypothetical protein
MARDEAMMFPNDRIRTWLADNRANSQEKPENLIASPDKSSDEELPHDLDSVEMLEPDVLG